MSWIPALFGLSLASCVVVEDSRPLPPMTGFLTGVWTVAGSDDARACARWRIDSVEMSVFDASGYLVSRASAPCEDFEISLELDTEPLGSRVYDAELMLFGPRGEAASDPVSAFDLRVDTDTDLTFYVDFPPGSIL